MLDVIRDMVNESLVSQVTFSQFFQHYVTRVQDDNIENEAISRFRNLDIDIKTLSKVDRSIEAEQRKWVNDYD